MNTEMLEVSRELREWGRRQTPPVASRARSLAENLKLHSSMEDTPAIRRLFAATVADLKRMTAGG